MAGDIVEREQALKNLRLILGEADGLGLVFSGPSLGPSPRVLPYHMLRQAREMAAMAVTEWDDLTAEITALRKERDELREALFTAIRGVNDCTHAICADTNGPNCSCGIDYRAALGERTG